MKLGLSFSLLEYCGSPCRSGRAGVGDSARWAIYRWRIGDVLLLDFIHCPASTDKCSQHLTAATGPFCREQFKDCLSILSHVEFCYGTLLLFKEWLEDLFLFLACL